MYQRRPKRHAKEKKEFQRLIEKLKRLALERGYTKNQIAGQHTYLIEIHHMLMPPWSIQAVVEQYNKTDRAPGFALARRSLLDSCILAITKLLLDGDGTDASLLTMVRPFLAANRPRHAELLRILERDYSAFQTVISPEQAKNDPFLAGPLAKMATVSG